MWTRILAFPIALIASMGSLFLVEKIFGIAIGTQRFTNTVYMWYVDIINTILVGAVFSYVFIWGWLLKESEEEDFENAKTIVKVLAAIFCTWVCLTRETLFNFTRLIHLVITIFGFLLGIYLYNKKYSNGK